MSCLANGRAPPEIFVESLESLESLPFTMIAAAAAVVPDMGQWASSVGRTSIDAVHLQWYPSPDLSICRSSLFKSVDAGEEVLGNASAYEVLAEVSRKVVGADRLTQAPPPEARRCAEVLLFDTEVCA